MNLQRRRRIGDIIYVPRFLDGDGQRLVSYHHAGIVRQVDNEGRATRVVHFDPNEFGGQLYGVMELLRGVEGVRAQPLDGGAEIARVFDPNTSWVAFEGPEDEEEKIQVTQRIDASLQENNMQTYFLGRYNCQHFTHEMRYGTPHSDEIDALMYGMLHGMECTARDSERFWLNGRVNSWIRWRPFSDTCCGSIANFVIFVIVFLVILFIFILREVFVFGCSTYWEYRRRHDAQHHHE
jgi:hypothetical protein